MSARQCPCWWQAPLIGMCHCGHTANYHDAGECWGLVNQEAALFGETS